MLTPIHLVPATALTTTFRAVRRQQLRAGHLQHPRRVGRLLARPGRRYVWDLTDRSRSRWIVPFGASGRPGDPHFADQFPLWVAGDLIPLVTDWAELKRED